MRIGFAICDPGLSFGAIVGLGAKERAAELGVELSVVSVFTPAEQAAVIERFVRDGVAALIVEAIESRIVLPAIREATAAGIPVVIADMGISGAEAVCSVRSDNVRGGELAAEYLTQRLGGHGRVAVLRGLLTSDNGLDRVRGFRAVMDKRPGIDVVFEGVSEWTRDAGAELMSRVLASHPDVDAVFGANDPLALGAVDAIAAAGRTGDIVVAGFDALPDALLAIEQGTMGATVRQAPRSIGRLAVELAVQAVCGEQVPPVVQTEVALVTVETLGEAALATLPLFPRVLRDLAESSAALAEERSLLRTLIDNLPDLIYVKDRDSRFVLANPSLLRLVGANGMEDVLGKTDLDLFPAELANQYFADEQEIITSGQPLINHEEQSVTAAGEPRWFSTTKVLARDSVGGFVGLVGMNRDITEQKQLEAQLLQAQKMETFGRLAGGIAHDFNNLLTVISGYAGLLLAKASADDPMREDLVEIEKAADRGSTLTQQLLAFARKQVLEPRTVDLNDLVLEIGKLLDRLLGAQVELFTLTCDDDLSVRADPRQIEQVLINLGINARDAMPDGGSLTIQTHKRSLEAANAHVPVRIVPGDYAEVSVRDTGVGMPHEVLDQAFEPFFTTKEVGKGTGLGLATCVGVIEQHDGYIWAESEVGRGTTVRLFLPLVNATRQERTVDTAPSTAVGGTGTVLLVEDEPAVRRLAALVLRQQGYLVLEASTGEEALTIADDWPNAIDLLLTDIVMPRIGGVAVSEQLVARRPGLKVLYMSGYTRSEIGQRGWLEDGVVLLQKPFSTDDLLRSVRATMGANPEKP